MAAILTGIGLLLDSHSLHRHSTLHGSALHARLLLRSLRVLVVVLFLRP